jgi:hypothetical protein
MRLPEENHRTLEKTLPPEPFLEAGEGIPPNFSQGRLESQGEVSYS